MWNPFQAARDRAEAREAHLATEREAFLQALTEIASHFARGQQAQAESIAELARATASQAGAVKAHLALFATDSAPISRVIRDEDEFENELRRAGFPAEGDSTSQLQWVLENT